MSRKVKVCDSILCPHPIINMTLENCTQAWQTYMYFYTTLLSITIRYSDRQVSIRHRPNNRFIVPVQCFIFDNNGLTAGKKC